MIFFLLIALPIILIYLFHKNSKPVKTLVPPGPPRWPFIGNLHQLGGSGNILHVHLWKLSKKYGPIFHMKLGYVPIIVISSAKLAKEVLKTHDLSFCSRPKLLVPRKLSYNFSDIVFSSYNHSWKELRKLTVTHLFSPAKIQSFRRIREDEISIVLAKISCFATSKFKEGPNTVVNLSELARVLSSNLICRVAFGKRYDEKGPEMKRFKKLLHDVQTLMASFFVSDFFPAFSWVDKLTGLINRLDVTCKNLDSFYQELIDEHLDPNRVKKMNEAEDFLDMLIHIKQDKTCSIDLSWDRIKALLMNIFIAATESSAASIVWIMTSLIKEPKIMKKVQAEIRNLSGKNDKVNEDDLSKLHYLKAVINETLRLYPPAPLLVPREAMERCTLEGYKIEPKTVVYVNAWAVARDPECWENPDEFLPERFLNSNIDIKGQDFAVIPFGSGRRICPGMTMGLLDVEFTIANLLNSFDWELPTGIQVQDVDTDVLPGIAMHKKNALLVVPKKCS